MAKSQIEIEGLDELEEKINQIEDLPFLQAYLETIGLHIQGKVNPYPPSSIANSPGNPSGRWYERNFGMRSITGWSKRTSENLSKKWYSTVKKDSIEVGNTASYAPYVQGEEKQAKIHKERGWKTLEKTVEEEVPNILDNLKEEIDERLA